MQQEAAATDKKEANNLRVIALASGLTGLANNMPYAVWQPFILSLGASMSILGLLESRGGHLKGRK